MMRSLLVVVFAAWSMLAASAQVKKEPGLVAQFSAGGKSDSRTERLAALYVAKGSPATPFLPAGPFTAVFKGEIASPLRGEYTFIVEVRGQVKVSINGVPVLDAAGAASAQYADKTVQLNKGANPIVIEYKTDGEEDAQFRFDWASKEFPREPVPPMAWQHAVEAGEAEGALLREGRTLFASGHCTACHDAGTLVAMDGTGMMEMLTTAPDLIDAGARFQAGWIAAWVENPKALRPSATMPHLPLSKEQAGDLAAYLVSLGKPVQAKINDDLAAAGGGYFAKLGCIACHTPPDFAGADEQARMPMAHVKGKFQPAALIEFLKFPGTHSPYTRMPNFRLTEDEAAALASYLLNTAKTEFPVLPGDAAKGKALAASSGCANCHQGLEKSTLAAPSLAAIGKTAAGGCLAEKPEKTPDFSFTAPQREALGAFLKGGLGSMKQDSVKEYAERQIHALNCTACHPRDGRQSVFQLVEEQAMALISNAPAPEHAPEGPPIPPMAIPALTWFGEKLQTGYMTAMIAGAPGVKPRPWLASRMPGFGAPAGGLAFGLSFGHGFPLNDFPEPAAEPEKIAIGAKLISNDGGLNCIQCHGVREQAATSVFEAPGINFDLARQRLRKTYYQRWMLHPLRVDPETKMPKFSEDGKTTQLTDVLEGKAPAQFEAVWDFLRSLK
jgi:mono/diheme cytochrome c family protein